MFLIYYLQLFLFRRKYRRLNSHNRTTIRNFCDLSKVIVGKETYGIINVTDFSPSSTKLYIGSYCSIAPNVAFLLGGEHQLHSISTFPFKVWRFGYEREAGSKGNIVVSDDVWIGEGAIICSGVTIGQGAVVAAGSVVARNVEPYSVVGGNPARHIKYRFDDKIRAELLKIDIAKLFDSFNESDIDLLYSELTDKTLAEIKRRLQV